MYDPLQRNQDQAYLNADIIAKALRDFLYPID